MTTKDQSIRKAQNLFLEATALQALYDAGGDRSVAEQLLRERLKSDPTAREVFADVTDTLSVARRPSFYINRALKVNDAD